MLLKHIICHVTFRPFRTATVVPLLRAAAAVAAVPPVQPLSSCSVITTLQSEPIQ